MRDKKRLNVHVYVTPVCNLRCKHCYYWPWLTGNISDRLLTIRQISLIIMNLCDAYDGDIEIEGGEIFLRKDIATLFEVVPVQYWSNVTITTNGTVEIGFDHRHLRHLGDLRVSVEGHTDELQQDIRGIPLRPVLKTCSDLRSSGVPVTLRITLHRKNFRQLIEMINHFMSLGFISFSLFEFQPVGRGRFHKKEYGLGSTEMEDVLRLLYSNPIPDGMEEFKLSLNAGRVPLVMKHREALLNGGFEIVDLSGVPSLTINYNGDLGVCPWIVGHDRIGTLRSAELHNDVAKYIESGRLDHVCKHCSAIRIWYQRHT